MPSTKKLLQAAAGSAGGTLGYVEDVFSTYLYTGTGAAHTITNGIDLSGEGGLTWIKTRNTGTSAWHSLSDTERGAGNILRSDLTNAQNFDTAEFTSFNSDGFTVGNDAQTNGSGRTYASWSFRKAEKFFDIQTWTGNGSDQDISHNLGSTPGFVIIKATSTTGNWSCWHSALDAAPNNYIILNSTGGAGGNTVRDVNSSTFEVYGNYPDEGSNGVSYVGYVFASDAGGFGDDGSESIIKCGSVTTDGSGDATVALGFEPQWVMLKRTDGAGTWAILDTMRGYDHSSSKRLMPNVADAEENYTGTNILGVPTATGFTTSGPVLDANSDYIYIAIRRPMKTPEAGTEVFSPNATTTFPATMTTGFPVDLTMTRTRTAVNYFFTGDRLRGNTQYFSTATTNAEAAFGAGNEWLLDSNTTITQQNSTGGVINYNFKRATGFMDVVAYTGNGTAGTAQAHNLGVVPEMMIGKNRSNSSNWMVYHTGATYTAGAGLKLNTTAAGVSNTYDFGNASGGAQRPDASSVYLGGNVNSTNDNYILYLFATLAGVSKVGSYTGTGSDLNVDCGFSAGARWIMIKRSDSTGDWYVWDSVRGITAGNDPYLLLNSTAAEVTNTDYVDPLSSGFTVTSSAPAALNASGGTYIFLAIA